MDVIFQVPQLQIFPNLNEYNRRPLKKAAPFTTSIVEDFMLDVPNAHAKRQNAISSQGGCEGRG